MDDQKNKTSEVVHKFAPVSPVINCSFGDRVLREGEGEREREQRGDEKYNTYIFLRLFYTTVLYNI